MLVCPINYTRNAMLSAIRSKRSRGEATHTIGGHAQGWLPMEEATVRW